MITLTGIGERARLAMLLERRHRLQRELREVDKALTDLRETCPHLNVGERRRVFPPWVKFCRDCGAELGTP